MSRHPAPFPAGSPIGACRGRNRIFRRSSRLVHSHLRAAGVTAAAIFPCFRSWILTAPDELHGSGFARDPCASLSPLCSLCSAEATAQRDAADNAAGFRYAPGHPASLGTRYARVSS